MDCGLVENSRYTEISKEWIIFTLRVFCIVFFKSNVFCLRPIAYHGPNIMDVNDNRNLDRSDNKNESSEPSLTYFKFFMFCK